MSACVREHRSSTINPDAAWLLPAFSFSYLVSFPSQVFDPSHDSGSKLPNNSWMLLLPYSGTYALPERSRFTNRLSCIPPTLDALH
jgi:hypothetical protein